MADDRIRPGIDALDDDFNFFHGGPPGEAALAALEAELGRTLPAAHRAFIAGCGCAAIVVKDEVWPAPVAYEIRPAWQMVRGLEIFGVAPPGHPLSALVRLTELRARGAEEELVPLAKLIGAARYLCVDLDGDLVWWEPDGGEAVDAFDDVVLEFLTQLAEDKERVKREGIQS